MLFLNLLRLFLLAESMNTRCLMFCLFSFISFVKIHQFLQQACKTVKQLPLCNVAILSHLRYLRHFDTPSKVTSEFQELFCSILPANSSPAVQQCCFISCFKILHTFSTRDRSGLQAGRSRTCTLFFSSHCTCLCNVCRKLFCMVLMSSVCKVCIHDAITDTTTTDITQGLLSAMTKKKDLRITTFFICIFHTVPSVSDLELYKVHLNGKSVPKTVAC